MNTRKNGYYWIKLRGHKHSIVTENGWEIGYFAKNVGWYSIWNGGAYWDEDMEEINENILLPE